MTAKLWLCILAAGFAGYAIAALTAPDLASDIPTIKADARPYKVRP